MWYICMSGVGSKYVVHVQGPSSFPLVPSLFKVIPSHCLHQLMAIVTYVLMWAETLS